MTTLQRRLFLVLCVFGLAGCSGAPGEPSVVGSAEWETPIAEPATLTVELVPAHGTASLPVFSVTTPLEATARHTDFRLPYDPLQLEQSYRLSARLDHGDGLLLSEGEEQLTLRGEGFERQLRLTSP